MNGRLICLKFSLATLYCCVFVAALTVNPLAAVEARADYGNAALNNACRRVLTADVVAFDMPLMWNRYGAQNINGMMFALRRDVVHTNTLEPIGSGGQAGKVTLRPDKRPRPLVLRMGAGDCLAYTVTNLLDPNKNPFPEDGQGPTSPADCDATSPGAVRSGIGFNCNIDDQVTERRISLHFQGTEPVMSIDDDGSYVGDNPSSLIGVGSSRTYIVRGPKEGAFVGSSYGATFGGEGLNGMTANGLWAVLNISPIDSSFYRAQVTREDMDLAAADYGDAASGHPVLNYEARYDDTPGGTWDLEGKGGLPILNMVDTTLGDFDGEIVHSDINALVAYGPGFEMAPAPDGPYLGKMGHFPKDTYPLESVGKRNPTVPNRLEPFRELTVAFHDEVSTKQAFPRWFEDPILRHTLHGVRDSFMINYGSGGIGSEIISNRLRVGPPHDCINCAYEEFFLTAYTVADVAMLADVPANFGLENCVPTLTSGCEATGPKATKALFPDDPSNVHHSYTGEFVKMRNVHAGPGEQHVFHQHNHQWLFNANDDNSNYLDAQGLGPGAGYTYEFVFGGAGNRNKTVGDAIFHCHFYPHFAQGMWEMWRVHDVFERGTEMQASVDGVGGIHESFTLNGLGIGDGTPATGARALPDPEIVAGTPIPGVVPLPGKAMAPMPIENVTIKANPNTLCVAPAPTYGLAAKDEFGACPAGYDERSRGSLASLPAPDPDDLFERSAGYPFWVAGIEHTVGQRPPTPPLDMITSAQASALQDNDGPLWAHPGFDNAAAVQGWDGGLPRFSAGGFSEGSQAIVSVLEPRLDLSKEITKLKPYFYPEEGTEHEKHAMAYHSVREHDSPIAGQFETGTTTLKMGKFTLNGGLPVPGAPYNEPCIDDRGQLMVDAPGAFFDADFGMSVSGISPFTAVTPRVYKAANVQIDAVFNKLGYHYPQQRIIALWQDVVPSVTKERPPEPLVMRINTFDCTQYVHSNVVPKTFELDDYQVRTPTDIIGQHIHLPKWDLTTADGAANGWNYEDGTLSPGAVVELIHAINDYAADLTPAERDAVLSYATGTGKDGQDVIDSSGRNITQAGSLHEALHPYFGQTAYGQEWIGARSTIQRWFADPVVNVQGVDRGLGIIFSHDHYGPSTHQQIGLYSTVLIEPSGSEWRHNETGEKMYTRTGTSPGADGGPTSWQAAILTGNDSGIFGDYQQNVGAGEVESHREFYFEYSDFQHAYQPGTYVGANDEGLPRAEYHFTDSGIEIGGPGQTANGTLLAAQGALAPDPETFRDAVQPSFRQQAQPTAEGNGMVGHEDFPTDIWVFPDYCPGTTFNADGSVDVLVPRPCPEAISADDPGMYVVNYRNESLAARVYDPDRNDCPDESGTVDEHGGCQAKGEAGDLAYAMSSYTTRKIAALNDFMGNAPADYFSSDNLCANGIDCPPINQVGKGGVEDLDPFTPMVRAYEGDRIHVKIQAGAHEEEHSTSIHGMKWLQAGSGFGEAKNSGWRNAQPAGISEQFSFRMPVIADQNQTGNVGDYAYNINSSLDGWVTGTWGIVRTIRNGGAKGKGGTSSNNAELFSLPGNDGGKVQLPRGMNGVCPAGAPTVSYDITAVLAEDVLPGIGIAITDPYPGSHAGRSPEGPGTLVYNNRSTLIPGVETTRGSINPSVIHDPTAIMYVMTADLVADDPGYTGGGANLVPNDPRCWRMEKKAKLDPSLPTCPVQLKPDAPIEPIVIRAAAGDCIEVTLRNKLLQQATTADANAYPIVNDLGKPVFEDEGEAKHLVKGLNADIDGDGIGDIAVAHADVDFDSMPDLATGNATAAMVRRDANAKAGPNGSRTGVTSFQTNLMAPSACVGLHPTLVEYDVTRADGTAVGTNLPSQEIVCPNQTLSNTFQWYAGHIKPVLVGTSRQGDRQFEFETTPIEFGGFNIMAADKIEQGQKGLVGAGVIYPAGSTWTVDPGTHTEATVTANGKTFRDFVTVAQKGTSMFYEDSFPVENILGEGSFGVAEDSQDMGQMAINYGNEALWLRFGVNPTDAIGFMEIGNAGDAYSNTLVGNADPETAVFNVQPGQEFRQHVLMPFGPGRGSTFNLHGHSWQRDPYICEGSADHGLPGKCNTGNGHAGTSDTGEVGSQALGINPIGMQIGGIESWFPAEHFEIFIPSAGGVNGVTGDYLFRDHMGLGNAQGLWGIIRVNQ